jgi:hypothetical protein
MRRTASRAHRKAPVMLVAKTRSKRAASIWSKRPWCSRMPALLTSAVSGPNCFTASSNRRTTSASRATSPCTAIARPPSSRIASTTPSAAFSSRRKLTHTA